MNIINAEPITFPECTLFGTLGCHLCEEALLQLTPLMHQGLQVASIDIVQDLACLERYGVRIPVLQRLDTYTELDWPFSTARVRVFLGV